MSTDKIGNVWQSESGTNVHRPRIQLWSAVTWVENPSHNMVIHTYRRVYIYTTRNIYKNIRNKFQNERSEQSRVGREHGTFQTPNPTAVPPHDRVRSCNNSTEGRNVRVAKQCFRIQSHDDTMFDLTLRCGLHSLMPLLHRTPSP